MSGYADCHVFIPGFNRNLQHPQTSLFIANFLRGSFRARDIQFIGDFLHIHPFLVLREFLHRLKEISGKSHVFFYRLLKLCRSLGKKYRLAVRAVTGLVVYAVNIGRKLHDAVSGVVLDAESVPGFVHLFADHPPVKHLFAAFSGIAVELRVQAVIRNH